MRPGSGGTWGGLAQRKLEDIGPLRERLDALRIAPGQELRSLETVLHAGVEPEHAAHELPGRDIGDLR